MEHYPYRGEQLQLVDGARGQLRRRVQHRRAANVEPPGLQATLSRPDDNLVVGRRQARHLGGSVEQAARLLAGAARATAVGAVGASTVGHRLEERKNSILRPGYKRATAPFGP